MSLPRSFYIIPVSIVILNIIFSTVSAEYRTAHPASPEQFSCVIVKHYPHDETAFTQGLAWDQGKVYEGTGLYGQSSLRRVDLQTGRIELKRDYEQQFFAEGITVFRDTIYQLTWKNNRIFQYATYDLSLIKSWPYPRQGWGITHDLDHLIVSDGTENLYFLDPETLEEIRKITVHDGDGPITRLNELEYIEGAIYANVWKTDHIVMIDPETGVVNGWLDLSGLSPRIGNQAGENVLNGIMYDPLNQRLFVTGKLWPSLFEIKLVPVTLGGQKRKQ